MVERLRAIELLEFERLGVGQADAHTIAKGVDREGVDGVVVVRHAPRNTVGVPPLLCGGSHFWRVVHSLP